MPKVHTTSFKVSESLFHCIKERAFTLDKTQSDVLRDAVVAFCEGPVHKEYTLRWDNFTKALLAQFEEGTAQLKEIKELLIKQLEKS
jgi:hypothetical protein